MLAIVDWNPRGAAPEDNGRSLRLQVKYVDVGHGAFCDSVGRADHPEDREMMLFAPGLPGYAAVGAVCAAMSKPVNFMVGSKGNHSKTENSIRVFP